MATRKQIANALADSFVEGHWMLDDLVDRGRHVLGKRWRWLRPMCRRLIEALGARRPTKSQVAIFISSDVGFIRACERHEIHIDYVKRPRPVMLPAAGPPSSWNLPEIVTTGALAEWLELSPNELDWFADRSFRERNLPHGALRHYRYHWRPKRVAGSARLIESPKWRLKNIQRRLLHGIFDLIPPHDSAHGFVRGRTIKSYVTPHVGQRIVVRMDLRDFFPSVPPRRVAALLRTAGYPEQVAMTLAALCTNVVPGDVWKSFPAYGSHQDRRRHESLYGQPHLPQGSPTSPALANLCSYRLDVRLSGFAKSMDARYTRYADDLLFSGGEELAKSYRGFMVQVYAIALDEGFEINARKTRVMRQSTTQHATGIVINEHPNIARADYDRLKAILHNCVSRGPERQNRFGHPEFRLHLAGRIGHVEMIAPQRGRRLRDLFEQIDWTDLQ